MTVVIEVKPIVHLTHLLTAVIHHECEETVECFPSLLALNKAKIHEMVPEGGIKVLDLALFFPLLQAVEEPVEVAMSKKDLWVLHGVLDQYSVTMGPKSEVEELLDQLSWLVGAQTTPPGE